MDQLSSLAQAPPLSLLGVCRLLFARDGDIATWSTAGGRDGPEQGTLWIWGEVMHKECGRRLTEFGIDDDGDYGLGHRANDPTRTDAEMVHRSCSREGCRVTGRELRRNPRCAEASDVNPPLDGMAHPSLPWWPSLTLPSPPGSRSSSRLIRISTFRLHLDGISRIGSCCARVWSTAPPIGRSGEARWSC